MTEKDRLFCIRENGEETRFIFLTDLNSAVESAKELELSVHAYLRAHNERAHTPEEYVWLWCMKEEYEEYLESGEDFHTFMLKSTEIGFARAMAFEEERGVKITRNERIDAVRKIEPHVWYRKFIEAEMRRHGLL